MEEDALEDFRKRWKHEIEHAAAEVTSTRRAGYFGDAGADGSCPARVRESDQPLYVSIAEDLLDGTSAHIMSRIQRKRAPDSDTCAPPSKTCARPRHRLLEQFLQDLNEVNDIPFFDTTLPYENALNIFRFLGRTDLGRCAQVSSSWKLLAEDQLLWHRLCLHEGFHKGASVSDSPCWKSTLRDLRLTKTTVTANWKNRAGSVRHLQYELGKVLCDVTSCAGLVVAGYSSGDVRLWDTLHWDRRYLRTTHVIRNESPAPHVSHVCVNQTVAAAAYENGGVDVWSTESGQEPVHQYQHLQQVHALDLSPDVPASASASGPEVRVDAADEQGYWRPRCLLRLHAPVEGVRVVPGRRELPLVSVWAGERVYLLDPRDAPEQEPQLMHFVYGQPVTCLEVCEVRAALGLRSCSWGMSDGGNKIELYSLESGQCQGSVGRAAGDFTCVNLRHAPPHLLVCGNKDRRVRVFDLRSGSEVVSLYAHHMGVSAVQADDWRIVSGGSEGLVSVWEMRFGAKLWEMHNRHPVRHIRFDSNTLVTANIPDEKIPRGACITDDDLTAHRRHRGLICHYDFSSVSPEQDHVLPICRSDYSESSGYNYNIGLTTPYDTLGSSHPAR